MERAETFAPLLIVVMLAFAVPLILRRFKRFGIPIVVGEILAGIAVGRSGLRWVTDADPLLNLLSELGFVFLMFLAGLEVDFSNVGGLGRNRMRLERRQLGPVPLGGLVFLLTLLISSAIGLAMVELNLARNPWMLALILSTTSLGVVMPVLKERGLSASRYGQSILVAALIADFGTMLLITILVAAVSRGLTLDILLVFVVLSQALGAEVILGAFLAGAVLSLLRTADDAELSHKLEAIGFGFFIPLFFVEVGLRFDLAALVASPAAMLLVPLLVLSAAVVKVLPGLLFRLSFSWREALGAGSLLSARLSLIIAASAIGLRLGLISDSVNAAIILVAVVTVTAAPLAFVRLIGVGETRGPRPILVFGMSELGLQIAHQLREHRELVVALDSDEAAVRRARQHGLDALLIASNPQINGLSACLEAAETVVCAHSDGELNYQFARTARTVYGVANVIACAEEPGQALRFEQLGAKPMNLVLDRAAMLALVARNPTTYALLTRTDDDKEVWEVPVADSPHLGKTLRQLPLPGDVLVLALRRNGDLLVPHGNTRIENGDHLTLVGSLEWVEPARQMLMQDDGHGSFGPAVV